LKTPLNFDDLCEINMEDTMYDFADIEEVEDDVERDKDTKSDTSPSPFVMKVICEDDMVCLLQ